MDKSNLPSSKICIAIFSLLARQAPIDLIPLCAYLLRAEYPSAKYLQFVFIILPVVLSIES